MNQRQEVTCWNKGNQENRTCGGGKSSKHLEGSCGPVRRGRSSSLSGRVLPVFVVDELADGPPVEVLEVSEMSFCLLPPCCEVATQERFTSVGLKPAEPSRGSGGSGRELQPD